MTSKERVIRSINHQEPDRVPIGEWGIDHDHVSRILGHHSYWRNRKDTTLALWEGRRDEVVEGLKRDCIELVEKLDYDIITVDLVAPKGYRCIDSPVLIAEGVWQDSKGSIYRYATSNDSIEKITTGEQGREAVSDAEITSMMHCLDEFDESVFELTDFIGDRFGGERAVLFRGIDIYGVLMNPFGGDYYHQLILTSIAPEAIKKFFKFGMEYNKKLISHCAQHGVLIAMQGYDFCMNSGCIFNPSAIRSIFFPFMREINNEIKRYGMVPFFHCCGNTWDLLDDFVRAGYEGYQSIQKSAGMDWKDLKARYGGKLTLWTGVQCETLISGTMEETEREVSLALADLMESGGFLFGSTNSIQFGAKTDNYLKALEIVREKGIYR